MPPGPQPGPGGPAVPAQRRHAGLVQLLGPGEPGPLPHRVIPISHACFAAVGDCPRQEPASPRRIDRVFVTLKGAHPGEPISEPACNNRHAAQLRHTCLTRLRDGPPALQRHAGQVRTQQP